MKKYKVVNEDWDLDFGTKKLEECIMFESNKLNDCKKYAKENNISQDRIVK